MEPLTRTFDPGRDGYAFRNDFVNRVGFAETRGRCGGMAFAALDHWHHRVPIPDRDDLPPDGDPLTRYVYARQLASLRDNGPRFLRTLWTSDQRLARTVRDREFPRLRALLDRGIPQPLGLAQARDLRGLAHDHQVVAYGYEQDATTTRINVWDNKYGRRADVLEFTTRYDPADPGIRQSDGSRWRGFFVERYRPRRPTYAGV